MRGEVPGDGRKPPKPSAYSLLADGGATGRTQPDRRLRIDLQHARARIAIGGLIDALEFNRVKRGSFARPMGGGSSGPRGVAEHP